MLFHWDRKKKKSCRLRVAQVWSGKQWGGQFIPRIGMEAVVEFLEGDPDRPLVVGTVYNGDYKHPYKVPDNKTQSGVKSDSSIGHGGYNEFMFEDKKNAEQIKMHAEKDHDVVVLNKETWQIGREFTDGGASRSTTLVMGDDELTIATGGQTITLMRDRTITAAGNQTTTTMGNQTMLAAMNIVITAQMNVVITGLQSIQLVCGASVISMTPLGITIASPNTVVA